MAGNLGKGGLIGAAHFYLGERERAGKESYLASLKEQLDAVYVQSKQINYAAMCSSIVFNVKNKYGSYAVPRASNHSGAVRFNDDYPPFLEVLLEELYSQIKDVDFKNKNFEENGRIKYLLGEYGTFNYQCPNNPTTKCHCTIDGNATFGCMDRNSILKVLNTPRPKEEISSELSVLVVDAERKNGYIPFLEARKDLLSRAIRNLTKYGLSHPEIVNTLSPFFRFKEINEEKERYDLGLYNLDLCNLESKEMVK